MEFKEMRKLMLAITLAAAPVVGFAQTTASTYSTEMGQGLSMLELSASKALDMYGVEADVMTLSLSQLAAIKGIVDTGDDMSAAKQRIQAAIAR
jgi:hypothetical protein